MNTLPIKTALALGSFIPPFLVTLATASVLFVTLHSAYIVKSDLSTYTTRIKTGNMNAHVYVRKVPEASHTLVSGVLSANKQAKG